jgi:hypothetical protein
VCHTLLDEDSILVECDAVSFGEWRPKFQRIVLPSVQGLAIQKKKNVGLFGSKYERNATFRNVEVYLSDDTA